MPRRYLPLVSVAAVFVVIAAWFLAARLQLVDPLFLPGPIEVLTTAEQLIEEGYRQVSLWMHILVSVGRAMFAFFMAAITGIPIGLLMGRSPIFNAILDPFVQFLRPLPKLALIPLVVVWFGIGEVSNSADHLRRSDDRSQCCVAVMRLTKEYSGAKARWEPTAALSPRDLTRALPELYRSAVGSASAGRRDRGGDDRGELREGWMVINASRIAQRCRGLRTSIGHDGY